MCYATRLLLVPALVLAVCGPAMAQEKARADVGVSYTILRDQQIEETLPVGWLLAAAGHLTDSVSVVGEAGGNYKTITLAGTDVNLNMYTFLGGIRFGSRTNPKAVPFGQVLAGVARAGAGTLGFSGSSTGFAIQSGAGVDIEVKSNLAVRLQGDYRLIRDEGENVSEFRIGFGIVFGIK